MLALVAFLAQVAAPPTNPRYKPVEFVIIDNRIPKEKKTHLIGKMIFSCNYGIYNIGESGISGGSYATGDRYLKLKAALAQKFGDILAGHSLTVIHYSSVINGASEAISNPIEAALSGGASAPMIASRETKRAKCAREKMPIGWFDGSELSNFYSPIIFEFEGVLDGKTVSARTVRSPRRELMRGGIMFERPKPADLEDFNNAYKDNTGKILDAVASLLSK